MYCNVMYCSVCVYVYFAVSYKDIHAAKNLLVVAPTLQPLRFLFLGLIIKNGNSRCSSYRHLALWWKARQANATSARMTYREGA